MRSILVPLLTAVFAFSASAQDGKPDVAAIRQQAQAAVEAGDWVDAAAGFRKLTEAEPKEGRNWHMLGYCLHAAGKLDEALAIHVKATEFKNVAGVAAYNAACVHALKNEKDKAFAWLEKAVAMGFAQPEQLESDSDMDNLRQDPRFAEIGKKLAAAAEGAGGMQAYIVTTPRQSARVAFFGKKGSPGQLALDWGPVEWQAKYDQAIDSPKMIGRKWRFGSDAWTSLDTSMPVVLGDHEFAPGQYYLTIEHKGDHRFVLGVHDAAQVRKQHLDASQAHKLAGGVDVAMEHAEVGKEARQLTVRFELPEGGSSGRMVVHFGRHELATAIQLRPAQ